MAGDHDLDAGSLRVCEFVVFGAPSKTQPSLVSPETILARFVSTFTISPFCYANIYALQ
jgi:hypothetical protein